MRVVEEPVADGVAEGGLADVVVSLGRRQLVRDDGRAAAVAVLEDLQQVTPLLVLHGGQAPVIEDQHVHAGELAQEAAVGAIRSCQPEVVEEARGAAIVGAIALAAGLLGEGTGDEVLAGARGPPVTSTA